MSKEAEIKINPRAGTIRLVIVERRWGTIQRRTQHTFRRREFERALMAAEVTVPWGEVLK